MYLGSIVGISNDYYEAALMDGATKWQQIKYITLPSLKSMMIVLTILAIGKIFLCGFRFVLPAAKKFRTLIPGDKCYRYLCIPFPEGKREYRNGCCG